MASAEYLEKMQQRQSYRNLWHTDLMRAITADTPYCCFSLFCAPCASYLLRKRALYNDMSRYQCCAGYMPCSGRCGESRCPEFCLCTEVFLCFGNSVASTRFLLQDEFNIQTTQCDNFIIGFMLCLQQLACIFSIIAAIVGSDEIQAASQLLNCLSDGVYCTVCACMQTQHKVEMDKRDGKFGPVERVMQVPPMQQMSRIDQAVPPPVGYVPSYPAQPAYGQPAYPQPYGYPNQSYPPQGYPPSGYLSSSPSLVQKILPSACINQPFRLLGARFNSHWLITMKFPDPQPTREEQIAAFEKTAANVFGSMEEAKKKIYVVSTTNYTGFKCEFPEGLVPTMEKQPGVTWVLPDCYAEPQYRPYGPGERYNNGVITPDPTLAYTRPSERNDERYMNRRRDSMPLERNDRRRDQDYRAPRMDGRGPMSPGDRQENRPPMGGRGPLPLGDRQENRPPMGGRGPLPSGDRQDHRPPMAERGPIQGERRDYMPPREPMQGRQEDEMGSQGRDPVQAIN